MKKDNQIRMLDLLKKKIILVLSLLLAMTIGYIFANIGNDSYITQPVLSKHEIDEMKSNIISFGSISDYLNLVSFGDDPEELRTMSYVMARNYDYPDAYYYLANHFKLSETDNADSLYYYLKEGVSKGSIICCDELLINHAMQEDSVIWLANKRRKLILKELNNITSRYTWGVIANVKMIDSIAYVVYKYDCDKTIVGHDWVRCTDFREGDTVRICFNASDYTISVIDVCAR